MDPLEEGPVSNHLNEKNVTVAKIQAMNLLFADFLMSQNNLLTLQEFVTEVPLLGNVYEISSYLNRSEIIVRDGSINYEYTRFCKNDVQDVLHVLGIQLNSDEMALTCQYYFNEGVNQCHSLLLCLFEAMMALKNNLTKDNNVQNKKECLNKSTIDSDTNEQVLNSWLKSAEINPRSTNLNEEQKNSFKKIIERHSYPQDNHSKDVAIYKEYLKNLEKENIDLVKKNTDLEQMVATYFDSNSTKLLFQKKQQLRIEQQKLCQLTNMIAEKENSLQEKLKDVENQKFELDRKEMEILRSEKKLKEELTNHNDETKIVKINQVNQLLQDQNKDLVKKLHEIKLKLNLFDEQKKNEQTSSSLDKEIVKTLLRENDELRDFIKSQQQKIECLSIKASNLAKQIEKTHQVFPVTLDHPTRNVKKKLNFTDNLSKENRYVNRNISSTTTDLSTTLLESDNQTEDDMVKEARSKCKMLDTKIANVEKNFKDLEINCISHNSDHKIIEVDRRPYNIHSNFSDDSDFDSLKNNSNKINLKELANKIGYHRSIRRSKNSSLSEIETSPENLRNTRFQNSTINVTYTTPIKEIYKESNKQSLRTESPLSRVHFQKEYLSNTYCTQLPKDNQSQLETTAINVLVPNTHLPNLNSSELNAQSKTSSKMQTDNINQMDISDHLTPSNKSNENIELKESDEQKNNSINQNQSIFVQESSSKVVTFYDDKRGLESDHSVSFGSNKTDKSSDFWA